MLVTANACCDNVGIAPQSGILGKELENMLEVGGICFGLPLAEFSVPEEKDVEEIISGPFGEAIITHSASLFPAPLSWRRR